MYIHICTYIFNQMGADTDVCVRQTEVCFICRVWYTHSVCTTCVAVRIVVNVVCDTHSTYATHVKGVSLYIYRDTHSTYAT